MRAYRALRETVGQDYTHRLVDIDKRLIELAETRDPRAAEPGLITLRAGGKRLRPLLVLVCGAANRATEEHYQALIRAAVSVELVHTAGLVHDDVLDDAAIRRGKPTIYASHGTDVAVTTGDLLFALAFEELTHNNDPDQIEALSDATHGLVRGELVQREDAWDPRVTRERYFARCQLKTSCLFEGAARLGAYAGGRPELVEALFDFGTCLGLAFQMADDVLDMTADKTLTGKTRGADLLDGTVTLPFIIAAEHDPSLLELDLHSIQTVEQAEQLCDRVAATGATQEVIAEAHAQVAAAKSKLEGRVEEDEYEMFASIAEQAVSRGT